jgi:hypothetical protein
MMITFFDEQTIIAPYPMWIGRVIHSGVGLIEYYYGYSTVY